MAKKIQVLLGTCYKNSRNDYERLIELRNKLVAHIDLDYVPTKDADELFLKLQNLSIDIPLIKKFLEILSQIFESISEYYELRIDFKLHEITTPMYSDPLIGDVNNILRKLDVYPVIKNTAHEKIKFDITKEIIEKCHKEKNELDTIKHILKKHAISHKGEVYITDDKNEIGLDDEQLKVLINKHVRTWIKNDDGVTPIYADDPEINNPLIVSLNNNPTIKGNLNVHNVLFRYSNRDMGRDIGIIEELRNVGKPAYTMTEELIQWIEDFYADKKVSPITCFIEHQGVDNFTGVNEFNGTVGIIE